MKHTALKKRRFFLDSVKVNPVIKFLTYSDILILSSWGLINPIIAVFFSDHIIGGNLQLAGIASTVFFLTKSIFQIPIARYLDKHRGEEDDFQAMVWGSLIISMSAFAYLWVKYPWQVLLVQVFYGIGGALTAPSWLGIFTRHIDKREEGIEWSLYYTSVDLGIALTGALGGFIASMFGYSSIFVTVGTLSFLGTLLLFYTRRDLYEM